MIKTNGPWFVDETGRTILFRGVNLGGSSKIPTHPNGATWNPEGFFDHRNVSFIGRPFPLEEADEHYSRLKSWGFNCLRFLITWEAVEHSGPGIYDEEYLEYLYLVIKKAGEYGFHVFIDPHQDVFSRFTGGDGAPGWTLEAAGFDIRNLADSGAAIVHQIHGDPFPRMIWPTNAYKLAAATMFTLFFAGNIFAPKTLVEGVPIQDYLQDHFFAAMQQVGQKVKDLDCVLGFDSLNEPQRGYPGLEDLSKLYGDMDIGLAPTPWQSFLLGAGFTQKIKHLERNVVGTFSKGIFAVNGKQKTAWLPGRECVWKQNDVWCLDKDGNPILVKPDHFHKHQGRAVNFVQDFMKPFLIKMVAAIRAVKPEWILFIESESNNVPPIWPEAGQMNLASAPHWYDGPLLYLKTYLPYIGFNEFNRQLILGTANVEKAYVAQLANLKQHSKDRLGNIPTLIGEFGIPYDLNGKKAFRTGDFSQQVNAMDRCIRVMEKNLLSYTIWNYTSDNNNEHGDLWNDEDLSIFSRDQQKDLNDLNSGGRALPAVIRPYPMVTAGEPLVTRFNPNSAEFHFEFKGRPDINAATEIFCPLFHYPHGPEITLSDGKIEVDLANQVVRYFSGSKETHTIHFKRKSA
jgi:hypothetical protein